MVISYAITVCNELDEIKRLVPFLRQYKRPEDEICVLLDKPKLVRLKLLLSIFYSSQSEFYEYL